MLRSW